MLKIYLIRHGKTQGNLSGKYIGSRTDEPLCQEGNPGTGGKELSQSRTSFCQSYETPAGRQGSYYIPDWRKKSALYLKNVILEILKIRIIRSCREIRTIRAWIDSGGALPFPGGEDPERFRNRCREGFCPMCGGSLCHGKSGNGHRRSRRYYYEYPQRLWISETGGILTGR